MEALEALWLTAKMNKMHLKDKIQIAQTEEESINSQVK